MTKQPTQPTPSNPHSPLTARDPTICHSDNLIVRDLGTMEYTPCWQAMQGFTDQRTPDTPDEIWFLEHPAVYTLGQNGKTEHILNHNAIPIVNSDRGGQVTYHGPGQLIAYTLIDLRRHKLGIRSLVTALELAVIGLLAEFNIEGYASACAPGVYVDEAKICSLGLRVRRGCAYHGLALNVDMDLQPFADINPCGYENLTMTQLSNRGCDLSVRELQPRLLNHLIAHVS